MKRFLVGLLLALPALSFAQSNFQKGYVVTNTGDTLKGYINYREQSLSPVSIEFRTAPDGSTQLFTLKNCSAYTVDGMESNERFLVNISMDKSDISRLSVGPDTTSRRDSVFLKVLQSGKNISMYSYVDDVKVRFYIREKGVQEPYELIRHLYMLEDNPRMVAATNGYLGQLSRLADKFNVGTDVDRRRLKSIDYQPSALKKAAYMLNEEVAGKPRFKSTRFFAGAGLLYTKINYQGNIMFADKSATTKGSFMPAVQAGIDVFLNPAIGKFIFRTDLTLHMSKSEVSVQSDGGYLWDRSFDQKALTITPQFIYNVYNKAQIKFFLGAGLGGNFSKYTNIRTTRTKDGNISVLNDEFKPESFNFSFPVTAGVVLNKKIEFSLAYSIPTSITNYVLYSASMQRLKFGVNYLFD